MHFMAICANAPELGHLNCDTFTRGASSEAVIDYSDLYHCNIKE